MLGGCFRPHPEEGARATARVIPSASCFETRTPKPTGLGCALLSMGPILRTHSFRSAAGGRYWLVKMSSAFGRFLKS